MASSTSVLLRRADSALANCQRYIHIGDSERQTYLVQQETSQEISIREKETMLLHKAFRNLKVVLDCGENIESAIKTGLVDLHSRKRELFGLVDGDLKDCWCRPKHVTKTSKIGNALHSELL